MDLGPLDVGPPHHFSLHNTVNIALSRQNVVTPLGPQYKGNGQGQDENHVALLENLGANPEIPVIRVEHAAVPAHLGSLFHEVAVKPVLCSPL